MRGRVRVTEDPGGVKGLIRAQAERKDAKEEIQDMKRWAFLARDNNKCSSTAVTPLVSFRHLKWTSSAP